MTDEERRTVAAGLAFGAAGLALLVTGAWLITPPLAIAAIGVLLVVAAGRLLA